MICLKHFNTEAEEIGVGEVDDRQAVTGCPLGLFRYGDGLGHEALAARIGVGDGQVDASGARFDLGKNWAH